MKAIRIGNDVPMTWDLFAEGAGFPLEGKSITLYIERRGSSERFYITDFVAAGSRLTFTFAGADQHSCGVYNAVCVVNEGLPTMHTFDIAGAFRLVPYSFMEGGMTTGNLKISAPAMSSSLYIGPSVQPQMGSYLPGVYLCDFDHYFSRGATLSDILDMCGKVYAVVGYMSPECAEAMGLGYPNIYNPTGIVYGGSLISVNLTGASEDEQTIYFGVVHQGAYADEDAGMHLACDVIQDRAFTAEELHNAMYEKGWIDEEDMPSASTYSLRGGRPSLKEIIENAKSNLTWTL